MCFLEHVQASKINEAVTACNDVNEAAEIFQELFSCILDFHAPRKIFQTRKNYVPYLSDETKLLMAERDEEEATKLGDETLMEEFRKIRNQVRKKVKKVHSDYYKQKLSNKEVTSKKA